jgi:hypothetical protein
MWGALALGALLPAALTALCARWLPLPWAVTLGLGSALVYLAGSPGLELGLWEITDWAWMALLLGLLLSQVTRGRPALAVAGWGLLALGALRPLVTYQWRWEESLLWVSLAVLSAVGGVLGVSSTRSRGILLVAWSLIVALALAATGSLRIGQLALAAAAVAAGALWRARHSPQGLLVPLTVSQLSVMGGLAFSSTPLWLGAALLLAPIVLAKVPSR